MPFDRDDLAVGFMELGSEAAACGKVIDLCVYGGSCLMLVSDFRQSSADVDAVAITDQAFIDRIAKTIAAKRGWPDDWINDGVRTFLSPLVDAPDDHVLTGTYPTEVRPGLRVYVPTPEYMLAMKLMAMRIDEATGSKDKNDILSLMSVVGIQSKHELISTASAYYPEAKVSAKLLLAADSLLAESTERAELDLYAPSYLGRSRGSREGG